MATRGEQRIGIVSWYISGLSMQTPQPPSDDANRIQANPDSSLRPVSSMLHTDRNPHNPSHIEDYYQFPETRAGWAQMPVDNGTNQYGEYLKVGENMVMMQWEKDAERTAVQQLAQHVRVHRPTFVIGGEGLGYATMEALDILKNRGGGKLVVVELHPVILDQGKTRIEKFLAETPPSLRENIEVELILGDFKDMLETFPDDSIDAMRIDLFPLSRKERDIDSVRHLRRAAKKLKPYGAVAPFIGHEYQPTKQQLMYERDREGNQLFTDRSFSHIYVAPPPRDVCPYFQGSTMAIAVWKNPVKEIFVPNK